MESNWDREEKLNFVCSSIDIFEVGGTEADSEIGQENERYTGSRVIKFSTQ
jgi:hypothetical protein